MTEHGSFLHVAGKEIERLAEPDIAIPLNPSLSPDGRYISLQRTIGGISSVWLLDVKRRVYSRLTSGHDAETMPIWSPQGDEIVFGSIRNGIFPDLFLKSVRDSRNEELLLRTKQATAPLDWSADGRFLLYLNLDPNTSFDLWVLPMDGKATPFPVVQTDHDELDGQFSPDGNWLAYESDESGQFEIYVQPFPGHGRKIQISTKGGHHVRWRHDGKELFYIGPDERLFAVSIRFDRAAKTIEPGKAIPLFKTDVAGEPRGPRRRQYVVSSDGQRFLMNTVVHETSNLPITVILNWKPEP